MKFACALLTIRILSDGRTRTQSGEELYVKTILCGSVRQISIYSDSGITAVSQQLFFQVEFGNVGHNGSGSRVSKPRY